MRAASRRPSVVDESKKLSVTRERMSKKIDMTFESKVEASIEADRISRFNY
jgi:hypothetical protein